ncbi:MAG TPA: helix-turn-helix transcriptional regulator [Pseudonocardia sp.]|uniref:helix-turn-helix domain-containing protein n=1 Tax=Pseudonocardia sp. TaxID=60912 RepID=UPI002F3F7BF2
MAQDKAKASPDDQAIGQRSRRIREQRGLSLEVAAGLAGLSKGYLSKLENGLKGFTRRGLIEDIAEALGCSVADLTGEPYPARDRRTAEALAVLPAMTVALYETPEHDRSGRVAALPLERLLSAVAQANALCEESRYALAGRELPALLGGLHAQAAIGSSEQRQGALRGLTEGYVVAFGVARHLGRPELAMQAATRARETAQQLDDPALAGFATLMTASGFSRLGARRAADNVLSGGFAEIQPTADPSGPDKRAAEALGVMHLVSAQLAARSGRADTAQAHLSEATDLAQRTGEQNTLQWHFGPANVASWSLAIAVETERGPGVAERIDADLPLVTSAGRRSRLHFDLARGYAQAEGQRDDLAIRHIDTADRIAPVRVRNDPIARDLVSMVDRRARRRVWELESLKRRLGVS